MSGLVANREHRNLFMARLSSWPSGSPHVAGQDAVYMRCNQRLRYHPFLPCPTLTPQEDAALPQIHLRSAAADANGGYLPPPDAVVLRGVETGSEPGLEYDADSEDELEELAQVVAKSPASSGAVSATVPPGGAAMAVRFRLLHDAWAAGMPRRRTPPSVASGSGVGM
mgnify:CR=1 FL=1